MMYWKENGEKSFNTVLKQVLNKEGNGEMIVWVVKEGQMLANQ